MSVSLKAGGNFVIYTGKVQSAADAFASIISYLDPAEVVYHWNNLTGAYELVITTSTMAPYGVYWIEVTQDCLWTYGAEAVAPSSVQLYGGRPNEVPYCGEAVSPADAFASILSYLDTNHYIAYFNNVTYEYEIVGLFRYGVWEFYPDSPFSEHKVMVPNGVYFIWPAQNCVWSFEVAVPPVAGTITKKEIDYQDAWQALPLYDIPVDTRIRVRITGRNDTSINQKMGIYWFVADPDGFVVQEYTNWEMFWTGPGLGQEFVSSGFDLSKVGTYTIWVELLMNPDDPEVVDRYIGNLCTVAAVVPQPEFAGFGITEYTKR